MKGVEVDTWHGRAVTAWRERWDVPTLRVFQRVDSTNNVAAEMARSGVGEGGLVLADHQTAGRGRRGRRWVAPAGASLSLSMVLRPGDAQRGLLTLRLGLAAAEAIESTGGVPVALKWPNDLLVGGRKVGGILCESESTGDRVAHVIAGMGINLAEPPDGWPDDLQARATSLEAAGAPVDGAELVGAVVDRWRAAARRAGPLTRDEQEAFDRRDALRDRPVAVDNRLAGTATGITSEGGLRVVTDEGERAIFTGTVRIQPQPGQRA